jgi:hypothetical protein
MNNTLQSIYNSDAIGYFLRDICIRLIRILYSIIISTICCFEAPMPLLLQSYTLSRFIVDMCAKDLHGVALFLRNSHSTLVKRLGADLFLWVWTA